MNKEVYAISACLMGVKCRYDGRDSLAASLKDWLKDKEYILICPEVMGGMSTPRSASERVGDRVLNAEGEDVTQPFELGANLALTKIREAGVSIVVLKSKSPTCGVGKIYDGNFKSNLIDGNGVFAQAALREGFACYSFEEFYTSFIEKEVKNQE